MSGSYYRWVIADLTSLEVVKSNCCMVLIPRETSYYEWVIAELTHRSPIKDLRSEPLRDVRLVLQVGYRRSYVSRGCQIKLLYGFDPSRDVVLWVGYRRIDTPVPNKRLKIRTFDRCQARITSGLSQILRLSRSSNQTVVWIWTLERCQTCITSGYSFVPREM